MSSITDFRNTNLQFNPGGRPYNNKDFEVLQTLVLDTSALLNAFTNVNSGQFIVSGCTNLGDPGFVWFGTYDFDPLLNDKKLRYIDTWTGAPLTYPCYIGETTSYQTRTYKDGNVKNVFVVSTAYWSQTVPASGTYLTFTVSGDFSQAKLSNTLSSIGASFWLQLPATSNIQFTGGNVGINTGPTVSPQAALEVVGSSGTILARNTSSIGYASVRIYNDINASNRSLEIGYTGSSYATAPVSAGLTGESAYISSTGAHPIQFATGNTFRMILDASGNLGIGTNTPVAKVHSTGGLRADSGASTGMAALFGGNGINAGYIEYRLPNGTRQGYMGYVTNGLGITLENGNNLVVTGGGLGVGGVPTHTLDVFGNGSISGGLNMQGSNINNIANGAAGADAVNLNQLNAEVTARTNAINSTNSALSTETTNRTNADASITSNLNSEITNRTNGDSNLQTQINALSGVPSGGIIMWTGTTAPTGWHLCDGTGGTPNLKSRFIVGYDPGDANYSSIGNAGGVKIQSVTLSSANVPAHNHYTHAVGGITGSGGPFYLSRSNGAYSAGGGDQFGRTTFPDGTMSTGYALGSGTTATSPGSTTAFTFDNRAPYYTLAYIMKL